MSVFEPEPRMLVLVVEDETLVRMFLSDLLDEAGFKVFEAVGADEALQVLQARPDVQAIVTDIEMPGSMSGLELARIVRDRWPGVGLVGTSGCRRPGPDELVLAQDRPSRRCDVVLVGHTLCPSLMDQRRESLPLSN